MKYLDHQVGRVGIVVLATDHTLEMVEKAQKLTRVYAYYFY